jgi:tRNA/tmRNA/rRNA uracil-C5-methylase (TrmA/RlmC/RlmD family)
MSKRLPPCPHRPPCPGCPRYGERGIAAPIRGRLEAFAAAHGVALEIVDGARLGFRQRARLAIRGRANSPKIGIFQTGTHRIVDIPNCRTHHPLVNRTAAALKQAIREAGCSPYADRPHRGDLRYVQVAIERGSGRAQVVLVGNSDQPDPLTAVADALTAAMGDALHSLWWNGQPERSNAILGPHWKRLCGEEAIEERIGGVSVFFPPGAFGQSHLDLADALVERVASWIPDGARVAEFYAGCGAIGLGLLRRSVAVTFNERSEHGLRGLELGLALRPSEERERARVEAGPAGDCVDALAGADSVVVDPPRKGLDPALLESLVRTPPSRLAYVSCDVDSFVRDAKRLLEDGRNRLRELTAFALFPYTEHTEITARFEPSAGETPDTGEPTR